MLLFFLAFISLLIVVCVVLYRTIINSNNNKNKKEFLSKFVEKEDLNSNLKSQTLIVASLARDSETAIPYFIKNIETLSSFFSKVEVYILENDSVDSTREILLKESEKRKGTSIEFFLVNEGEINLPSYKYPKFEKTRGHEVYVERISKMVFLRNDLLNSIRKIRGEKSGILFLTDCDIKMEFENIKGVKDGLYYLLENKGVDAVAIFGFLNGRQTFDPYARDENSKFDEYITNLKLIRQKYTGFKKVRSYFGGGVFYKYPLNFNYSLKLRGKKPICEHATLNENLNLYLNTNAVVKVLEH